MSEGIEYRISLADQMSGPAHEASESLVKLSRSLLDTKKNLSAYQQQLSLAKQTGDIAGYKKYTELVDQHKNRLFALNEIVGGSAKANEILAAKQRSAADSMTGVTTASVGMTEGLAGAAGAAVAVAAAVVAMGIALAAVTVKLIEFTLDAIQGKQAMIGMFNALAGGAPAGEEIEERLDGLSRSIGVTKDELGGLTARFQAMGVEGPDALLKMTRAAISARAIMKGTGGDGAAAFDTLAKKVQVAVQTSEGLKIPIKGLGSLAEAGLTVNDVSRRMNITEHALAEQLKAGTANAKKFGDAMQDALIEKGAGPLALLSNKWSSVIAMLKQNVGDMFEDLTDAAQPFLDAVKGLFHLFDSKSSVVGDLLKTTIGHAMTFVFGEVTSLTDMITLAFLKITIYSLKAYIYIKTHWSQFEPIIEGITVTFNVLVSVMSVVAKVALVTAASLLVIGASVAWLVGKISELVDRSPAAGKALTDGLVLGILSGIPGVNAAMITMITAGWEAAKKAAHINSPSRLMMGLGVHIPGGFAAGIQANKGAVVKASSDMTGGVVQGTRAGLNANDYSAHGAQPGGTRAGLNANDYRAPGAQQDGAQRGNAKQMTFGDVTVQITAPGGVTDAVKLTETALAAMFERLMLQEGV